jgi:RNA polymerase sigma-70 factor (ECF subfamily)
MHALETESIADPAGWLYRATANLAISRLRRERSFGHRLARFALSLTSKTAPAVDDVVHAKDTALKAFEALRQLPDRQRVVLSMKLLDGKSQREIAHALSLSEGYVSKLIDRAWGAVRAAGWEVSHEPV